MTCIICWSKYWKDQDWQHISPVFAVACTLLIFAKRNWNWIEILFHLTGILSKMEILFLLEMFSMHSYYILLNIMVRLYYSIYYNG